MKKQTKNVTNVCDPIIIYHNINDYKEMIQECTEFQS
jgi:hypothetical protein